MSDSHCHMCGVISISSRKFILLRLCKTSINVHVINAVSNRSVMNINVIYLLYEKSPVVIHVCATSARWQE